MTRHLIVNKCNPFRLSFRGSNLGHDSGDWSSGQIGIVMVFAIVALIGALALGADASLMYGRQSKLQTAVDASALAGAVYQNGGFAFTSPVAAGCTSQPDDAAKAACTYASANGLAVDSASLKIFEPGQNLPASVPTPNIQVWAQSSVPSYFGTVIGLGNHTISAIATAQTNNPVSTVTSGLFPMAVQCAHPCNLNGLNPGSTTQFGQKFSPTHSASGNWQWLALGATGSSQLGSNVSGGAQGSYSVGGPVSSEPGNVANSGQVKTAFASRMSSCPAIADPCSGANPNNIPPGDPCLVTVPAVDFAGCTGSCPVTIEGFANIYIEPSSTSANITACFINSVTANSTSGSSTASLGATAPPSLAQ